MASHLCSVRFREYGARISPPTPDQEGGFVRLDVSPWLAANTCSYCCSCASHDNDFVSLYEGHRATVLVGLHPKHSQTAQQHYSVHLRTSCSYSIKLHDLHILQHEVIHSRARWPCWLRHRRNNSFSLHSSKPTTPILLGFDHHPRSWSHRNGANPHQHMHNNGSVVFHAAPEASLFFNTASKASHLHQCHTDSHIMCDRHVGSDVMYYQIRLQQPMRDYIRRQQPVYHCHWLIDLLGCHHLRFGLVYH